MRRCRFKRACQPATPDVLRVLIEAHPGRANPVRPRVPVPTMLAQARALSALPSQYPGDAEGLFLSERQPTDLPVRSVGGPVPSMERTCPRAPTQAHSAKPSSSKSCHHLASPAPHTRAQTPTRQAVCIAGGRCHGQGPAIPLEGSASGVQGGDWARSAPNDPSPASAQASHKHQRPGHLHCRPYDTAQLYSCGKRAPG